jgi:hypothetical protein
MIMRTTNHQLALAAAQRPTWEAAIGEDGSPVVLGHESGGEVKFVCRPSTRLLRRQSFLDLKIYMVQTSIVVSLHIPRTELDVSQTPVPLPMSGPLGFIAAKVGVSADVAAILQSVPPWQYWRKV